MRIIIQKSLASRVLIDDEVRGEITKGFVLLVGVTHEDTMEDVVYCARKVGNMRLFDDEDGKTNLALKDVGGDILSISQFTLYGNIRKGNRPSFINAAAPDHASNLYDALNNELRDQGFHVETGEFGAYMQVEITNDGPMTILIDSKQKDL